jgi:hypothetical protein
MNINEYNLKTNDFDEIEDLDNSWLEEFEKMDNEYKTYYTEDLSFIKITSLYVNKNNDIEKLREEKILLKVPGFLQKEELISIIKHNSFFNQIKYSILSILKFNINIEPINLKTFLKSQNLNAGCTFLQSVKSIDTIKFDKSISMFHDINELIIIFHEKIYKHSQNTSTNQPKTKKLYNNSNANKYTKRKLFKENMI